MLPDLTPTDPRRKAPRTRLRNDEKAAQASLIMMRRLAGDASLAQLGEEFNLDPRTIQRRLALAKTDGVLDRARSVFVSDMLPQAMVVLQEALAGDDLKLAVDVAKSIVSGLKAMEGIPSATITHTVEESFEHFRQRLSVTQTVQPQPAAAPSPTDDLRYHSHEGLPLCLPESAAESTGEPTSSAPGDSSPSGEGSLPPLA